MGSLPGVISDIYMVCTNPEGPEKLTPARHLSSSHYFLYFFVWIWALIFVLFWKNLICKDNPLENSTDNSDDTKIEEPKKLPIKVRKDLLRENSVENQDKVVTLVQVEKSNFLKVLFSEIS